MLKQRGVNPQAAISQDGGAGFSSPGLRTTALQPRGPAAALELRMSPAAHRLCLWFGPALTLTYLLGWVLAGFIPIPSPDWPAEQLAVWLFENKTAYQLGCLLMLVAGGMIAPWGASLGMWTFKTEARFPVLFVAQMASLAASTALFVIIPIFWALAAFRATEISVEITQMLFDAGWFLFLWIGPVFYIWVATLGLGVLLNPPERQLYPRWIGYYCLASVLCWAMGLMMVFFRSGPTSYSGVLPTWIPLLEFFVWMHIMSTYGFRAIRMQEAQCRDEQGDGLGVYAPRWEDPIVDSVAERPSGL